MIYSRSDYPCQLTNITFEYIVNEMNKNMSHLYQTNDCIIWFVDGDAINIKNRTREIYLKKIKGKNIFMVTLTNRKKNCSPVINHLSDLVVCKRSSYFFLKEAIEFMLQTPSKISKDYFLGDIWCKVLKETQKEYEVLDLLFKGYPQSQISKILNLSVKTISGYKMKAVRRHGFRTFNELYIQNIKNTISSYDS